MMILHEAILSIKQDRTRASLYWMTLAMTTTLVYLFINILSSNPDPSAFSMKNTTWESVLIGQDKFVILGPILIILCCWDVFLAHNYYITGKTDDLQVRMICGTSFFAMAKYLLLQSMILIILSVPIGILAAVCLIPAINIFFPILTENAYTLTMTIDSFYEAINIIIMLLLYIFIVDIGFTYQNSSGLLVNWNSEQRKPRKQTIIFGNENSMLKRVFWMMLFMFSVIMIYMNRHLILVAVAMGMYSFNKCLNQMIPQILRKIIRAKENKIIDVASIGFFRSDIQMLSLDTITFVLSTTVFLTIFVASQSNPAAELSSFIALIVTTIMQAMIVMFRFSVELTRRHTQYESLSYLGLSPNHQKQIVSRETNSVYVFVFILTLLYIFSYLACLVIGNEIGIISLVVLISIIGISLLLCSIINSKIRFAGEQKCY